MTQLTQLAASVGLPLPEPLLENLSDLYASPTRAYHTLSHVVEVARHFRAVHQAIGWKHPRETLLAILFHDAVYVPGATDNEPQSAVAALSAIARWLPAVAIDGDRVSELIRLTADHGKLEVSDVDEEAALFLDCDMAILGAEPALFDAYEHGIATEYGLLPSEIYQAGRSAFLHRLLAKERIFLSSYFHEHLDAAARRNIQRLAATYQSPAPPRPATQSAPPGPPKIGPGSYTR